MQDEVSTKLLRLAFPWAEFETLLNFYSYEDDAIARDLRMIGQEGPVDLSARRHSVPIGVTINHAPHSRHTRRRRASL